MQIVYKSMKDPEKNGNYSFIILMLFIIMFYRVLLLSELRRIIIIIIICPDIKFSIKHECIYRQY